jgi:hypothetical protein
MNDGNGGPFASIGFTGQGSSRVMTIDGLYSETDYYFKVRAINEIGAGPFSTSTGICTKEIPAVPVPE